MALPSVLALSSTGRVGLSLALRQRPVARMQRAAGAQFHPATAWSWAQGPRPELAAAVPRPGVRGTCGRAPPLFRACACKPSRSPPTSFQVWSASWKVGFAYTAFKFLKNRDDDVSDCQQRLHLGHRRCAPLLHPYGGRAQRQHHQADRGEQRPVRRSRAPVRLSALSVLDSRHLARHVRKQVLASRVAGNRQDVRERDDCRLCLDPPPGRRPIRCKAGVPRRHQEQHRDEAFRLAVPALLPHWDPGSCIDQGACGGDRPLTLIIGWLVGCT